MSSLPPGRARRGHRRGVLPNQRPPSRPGLRGAATAGVYNMLGVHPLAPLCAERPQPGRATCQVSSLSPRRVQSGHSRGVVLAEVPPSHPGVRKPATVGRSSPSSAEGGAVSRGLRGAPGQSSGARKEQCGTARTLCSGTTQRTQCKKAQHTCAVQHATHRTERRNTQGAVQYDTHAAQRCATLRRVAQHAERGVQHHADRAVQHAPRSAARAVRRRTTQTM